MFEEYENIEMMEEGEPLKRFDKADFYEKFSCGVYCYASICEAAKYFNRMMEWDERIADGLGKYAMVCTAVGTVFRWMAAHEREKKYREKYYYKNR